MVLDFGSMFGKSRSFVEDFCLITWLRDVGITLGISGNSAVRPSPITAFGMILGSGNFESIFFPLAAIMLAF